MANVRRYNPRQPRDSQGRWTKGGTSLSRRKNSAPPSTAEYAQRAVVHSLTAAYNSASGRPIMAGVHASAAATSAYRVAAAGAALGVRSSTRLTIAQKRNFANRKAAVDKQVDRIEKAQSLALTGGYLFGLAATGAGIYNMSRVGKGGGATLRRTVGALGSGGAGLKAKRASRGGVYNITTAKR